MHDERGETKGFYLEIDPRSYCRFIGDEVSRADFLRSLSMVHAFLWQRSEINFMTRSVEFRVMMSKKSNHENF